MTTRKIPLTATLSLALVLTACAGGDSADSTTTSAPDSTTTTTTSAPAPPTTASPTTTTSTLPPVPPIVAWVDDELATALEGYAADFEVATGIPVVLEAHPADGIVTSALEAIDQGSGPDIFIGSHRWVAHLADQGIIASIPIPDADRYFPETLASFTEGEDLVGIPYRFGAPALFINPALIQTMEAGATDLEAVCEANAVTQQCLALPSDDAGIALAIVNAFGGYGFGHTGESFDPSDVGFDTAGGLAAADYLDGQSVLGSLVTAQQARDTFTAGRAAFLVDWEAPEDSPEGFTSIPYRPAGAVGDAVLGEVRGFMINGASEQPLAAQVFLTEFVAGDESMFDVWLAVGGSPTRTRTYNDAVLSDPALAATSPEGLLPGHLALPLPAAEAVMRSLGDAVLAISSGNYPEETPDARSVFTRLAEDIRALAQPAG